MPTTLESCENFFGTKNLYEIFEIEKKATVAEGRITLFVGKLEKKITILINGK